MTKPIAVLYLPYPFDLDGMSCVEIMCAFNGENPKSRMNEAISGYIWFVFPNPSIHSPELKVFHPKDFTEVEFNELKEMVTKQLSEFKKSNNI